MTSSENDMTYSDNGIGSIWIDGVYDNDDKRPRCATAWKMFWGLPIWPSRRAVITKGKINVENYDIYQEIVTEYFILDETEFNGFEIMFTYLWRWLIVLPYYIGAVVVTLTSPYWVNPENYQSGGNFAAMKIEPIPDWLNGTLMVALVIFVGVFLNYLYVSVLKKIECAALSIYDIGEEYEDH